MPRDSDGLKFVPLTPALHGLIAPFARDPAAREWSQGDGVAEFRANGLAEALLGRGRVLMAAGLAQHWPRRFEGWCLVHRDARPREIAFGMRRAQQVLAQRSADPEFARVEIGVRWDEAWRDGFAAALGFAFEGRLRRFGPDGSDYGLYARVHEETAPWSP